MVKSKQAYAVFGACALLFILIAFKGITTPQPGDENTYYYMGRLIAEGKLPYKDFFYAHPPLQIYLFAIIYKIFGFNVIAFKLVPLISMLLSSFLIFKIMKDKLGSAEALLSSLLFLFSYSIIFNSTFSFGVETATALLLAGVYFLLVKEKYIISGIFFGLAGITRLLSLVPIIAIVGAAYLSSRKDFIKFSSAFFIVLLLFNGILILSFGNNYLTQVYKFHLLKTYDSPNNLNEYLEIIKLNWILFASAALIVFAKEKKAVAIFGAASLVYLAFLLTLKKLFGFYFIPVFPFLAIIGGYSAVKIYQSLNLEKKWKAVIATVLLLIFAWNLISDTLFLRKIGFVGFERGNDIIEFVNSVSSKNTLVFGDDSVAPLLALLTDKKIALELVDTNPEVFRTKVIDLSEVLASLKGKEVLFIVRDIQGLSQFKEVRDFLNKECEFLSRFSDKLEGGYLIYKCS